MVKTWEQYYREAGQRKVFLLVWCSTWIGAGLAWLVNLH